MSGVAISPVPVIPSTDAIIRVRGCGAVSTLADDAEAVLLLG